MNHIECNQKLSNEFSKSKFAAKIGDNGGYIIFSNSGQRGSVKYFTISLDSLLTIFKNIRDNLEKFNQHEEYNEDAWRSLGGEYYLDDTANALSTVQTKPLFSTLSKICYLATNDSRNTDGFIHLSQENIDKSIVFLQGLISEYKPSIPLIPPISSSAETFDINSFIGEIYKSHLKLSKTLPFRFVASLQTKPFIILTGLSGSGKTKLAEAFSLWITGGAAISNIYHKGEKIPAARANYIIEDIDNLGVLIKSEGSTKTLLPFELIKIWAEVIIDNKFEETIGSQEIQNKVKKSSLEDYSPTLNSFHSQLKVLAFRYIKSIEEQYNLGLNNQICMVAVGADWTNREPLLGFPNALEKNQYVKPDSGVLDLVIAASKDPTRPYFLILDEMNMSHVERYFADFLSAMESSDGMIKLHSGSEDWDGVPSTINLPKNLFIIGTVNIDETTYMFSPKVLDRANVIEFRVSDSEMTSFFDAPKALNMDVLRGAGASMAESFVAKALEKNLVDSGLGDELMPFFRMLQKAGAEFGYRTATEMSRFVSICDSLAEGIMDRNTIVDAAIMQKLLPKLHGSRNKIEPILKELGRLCLDDPSQEAFLLDGAKTENKYTVKYKLSYDKLMRMHERVIADGFTSFAEA